MNLFKANLMTSNQRSIKYRLNRSALITNILCFTFMMTSCRDFSKFDCFKAEGGCGDSSSSEDLLDTPLPLVDMMLNPSEETIPPLNMADSSDALAPDEETSTMDMITTCEEGVVPCQECDPSSGESSFNDDDSLCPTINCEDLNRYELIDDRTCVERLFISNGSLCREGECVNNPDRYCISASETRLEISGNLECQHIVGCQNSIEPEILFKPGESCENGRGTCDQRGQCVHSPMSDRSCREISSNDICEDNLNEGICTFSADFIFGQGWVTHRHCDDFCQDLNGRCQQAWYSLNSCNRLRERRCDQQGGRALCQCSFSVIPAP